MTTKVFFPYSWHIDDKEEEITSIRIYGIDEKNKNICVRVDNFTPYIYIELPCNIKWTSSKAQLVGNKIDQIAGISKPLKKVLLLKKRLYGAHIDLDTGKRKIYPYLLCSFSSREDIKSLYFKIRKPIHVMGLGLIPLKIHESDADPILQLTCCRNIPTAGWVKFYGKKVKEEKKLTLCDEEYKVKWKALFPHESDLVPKPLIMGFDIEVNSTNPTRMPKPEVPGDKVFQVSCVLAREGDKPDDYRKFLLTLGDPDPKITGKDVTIIKSTSESDLFISYTDFIRKYNPNIIVGYNILGFDIPYMIARAKYGCNAPCISEFDKQGFHKTKHAKEKIIKWSSSAYKNQEFEFLDAEGRVYVDLLPLVKRDFKFSNYKLKTISEYFIGETKDPLDVKGIFKCYRIGVVKNEKGGYDRKARKAMAVVGKYCVQDSALVVLLMDKLKTWVGLTEMAKTCNVPIFTLYTQGQQIKVYSQLYKYCMKQDIIVEKDGYQVQENERYIGAKVFPPIPGQYENIIPFDFASLYPTTIIAYNIDYHTWVSDDSDIPDYMCHVMSWHDHVGCCHDPKVIRKKQLTEYIDDQLVKIKRMREARNKLKNAKAKKRAMKKITEAVTELKPYREERSDITKTLPKVVMCAKRRYRFLKEPRGVLPTVIQNLLDARKHTRKVDMIKCKDEIKRLKSLEGDQEKEIEIQKTLLDVLNKRQLSYKVSANSMYGAMGVRRGYLPFMPGAMSTTYMGRTNIEVVAKTIPEKYGGQLIYGDTDCVLDSTPVLIKNGDIITYMTVEDLSDGIWSRINPNKEISKAKPGYKIWSDKGFTEIVNVVRCGAIKPLSRVVTHVGEVTCSNEHSLLRENLQSVKPCELELRDKLCISELPLPEDTPKEPKYPNNLTAEKIRDYIISDKSYKNLSAELAFVWGVFFADGSCGVYKQKEIYDRCSWAINKKDDLLLERCLDILTIHETSIDFKILDTIKSSSVNKLVAKQKSRKKENIGDVKKFVVRYRSLFYNSKKCKKIPDIIFNSPYHIREAFFMGYYAGDGSKKDPALTMTNKGAIGSAGLFFLLRSIGYKVSVNTRKDKFDCYKLTGSSPKQKFRYHPKEVKKIVPITQKEDTYIYDIQTGNHHFAAGVGQIVVHNSNYIYFPHLKNAQETWDYALEVADEVTKLFPPPIKLEFEEEIYAFFFILSKKRYMYRKCLRDGVVDQKIGKKGVLLARRDNSKFVRDVYEGVIGMIADNIKMDDILYYVLEHINEMCSSSKDFKDFVITKSVGDIGELQAQAFFDEKGRKKAKVGDYTVPILSTDKELRKEQMDKKGATTSKEYYSLCLPAQVQLAEKMRRRGQRVDSGSRIEYVVCDPTRHTAKQYEKVESADYLAKHRELVKIDFLYYLKALVNPLDQVLDVAFQNEKRYKKGFTMWQYKYRWKIRSKLHNELLKLFKPDLKFG